MGLKLLDVTSAPAPPDPPRRGAIRLNMKKQHCSSTNGRKLGFNKIQRKTSQAEPLRDRPQAPRR